MSTFLSLNKKITQEKGCIIILLGCYTMPERYLPST